MSENDNPKTGYSLQKLVVTYSDEYDELYDFMKSGSLSSCPQKSVSVCHRVHNSVHKNMSVFVNVSTIILSAIICLCAHKFCQFLLSCPQNSVDICHIIGGPGVACATSRTVPGSIPGGVTGDFFHGSFRQNHVP